VVGTAAFHEVLALQDLSAQPIDLLEKILLRAVHAHHHRMDAGWSLAVVSFAALDHIFEPLAPGHSSRFRNIHTVIEKGRVFRFRTGQCFYLASAVREICNGLSKHVQQGKQGRREWNITRLGESRLPPYLLTCYGVRAWFVVREAK
jgi:hypothetical protein